MRLITFDTKTRDDQRIPSVDDQLIRAFACVGGLQNQLRTPRLNDVLVLASAVSRQRWGWDTPFTPLLSRRLLFGALTVRTAQRGEAGRSKLSPPRNEICVSQKLLVLSRCPGCSCQSLWVVDIVHRERRLSLSCIPFARGNQRL